MKTMTLSLLLLLFACAPPTSVQEGVASYYADSLHGEPTANGETYNKRARSAAHRTLPFDTRVKVTNLDNGKAVWVTINDRGPYADDRVIDLSRAAAGKIDMIEAGTARVKLEIYE